MVALVLDEHQVSKCSTCSALTERKRYKCVSCEKMFLCRACYRSVIVSSSFLVDLSPWKIAKYMNFTHYMHFALCPTDPWMFSIILELLSERLTKSLVSLNPCFDVELTSEVF